MPFVSILLYLPAKNAVNIKLPFLFICNTFFLFFTWSFEETRENFLGNSLTKSFKWIKRDCYCVICNKEDILFERLIELQFTLNFTFLSQIELQRTRVWNKNFSWALRLIYRFIGWKEWFNFNDAIKMKGNFLGVTRGY